MLFSPLKIGDIEIKNRIVMAPLTRCRAKNRVPNSLMAQYYSQRASAGLILTEATSISPQGVGYPDTPGIWSDEQVAGWKLTTTAVHTHGSKIFLQLWHVGRISDPFYLDGQLPVAPSAIAPKGQVSLLRPSRDYVTPRALDITELPKLIEDYKIAAANAKAAGFDGVEVHAANGYLIDQFLQDSSNKRDDKYGGSIENRCRFLLEIVDAVTSVFGAGRVGVHLAPRGDAHDMGDSNPQSLFLHIAQELGKRKIAFICTREHLGPDSISAKLKDAFGGALISNEQFDRQKAIEVLEAGEADAVAFGRLFIANPDLPERLKRESVLNTPKTELFYASGPEGYTDYPTLELCEEVNRNVA